MEALIKSIPTDTSGRWVSVEDLPKLGEAIIKHIIDKIEYELEIAHAMGDDYCVATLQALAIEILDDFDIELQDDMDTESE